MRPEQRWNGFILRWIRLIIGAPSSDATISGQAFGSTPVAFRRARVPDPDRLQSLNHDRGLSVTRAQGPDVNVPLASNPCGPPPGEYLLLSLPHDRYPILYRENCAGNPSGQITVFERHALKSRAHLYCPSGYSLSMWSYSSRAVVRLQCERSIEDIFPRFAEESWSVNIPGALISGITARAP